MMKKTLTAGLLVLIALSFGSLAQNDLSDEELLGAMDMARFAAFLAEGVPSTTFTSEILADRPDGSKQAVVQVSFKLIGDDVEEFARIDYLSPEELAGDVFIVTPEDIFFWNPDLFSPLKVNGQFEVFGDATVAEVVGIVFSGDYTIAERSAATLDDGTPIIELNLEATRDSVAFPFAKVIANAETLQPITLELYALSGELLHVNTFESYAEKNGAPYFERQLLDNRIIPVNKTLLIITNIENKELADEMFDPSQLGN